LESFSSNSKIFLNIESSRENDCLTVSVPCRTVSQRSIWKFFRSYFYCKKHLNAFLFYLKIVNRFVANKKAFCAFILERDPYREIILTAFHFLTVFHSKTVNFTVFWYSAVRDFSLKRKTVDAFSSGKGMVIGI